MITIKKIRVHNFKRFRDLEINVNPDINIFVGDNESGKSTILQSIDLVARGSRARVEHIGLDRLFNVGAIEEFMDRRTSSNDKFPEMFVELYLSDESNPDLVGQNNSEKRMCSGIRMRCSLNSDYFDQAYSYLQMENATFPLEFYSIDFDTFAGTPFNGYTRKLHSMSVDNSNIGSPRAMRDYVNDIYRSFLTEEERTNTRYQYKNFKVWFQQDILDSYSESIKPYSFGIRESSDENIETAVILLENNIPLENKGTGTQCFIKTKLAMKRANTEIDSVLIEEPENHLSYTKMLELIDLIKGANSRQLFISTHSDLIATRLNLKKCLLFSSSCTRVTSLASLSEETADFFMKAPNNNMLRFVLAPKSILVEGDSEYILMEEFYRITTERDLSQSGIGVISVGGKTFKRYLEISKLLDNKVAVVTDNDGDYLNNIHDSYSEYSEYPRMKIFSDKDNSRYTFEVCVYSDNKEVCEQEFQSPRRKLPTLDYMLRNKTLVAFQLLTAKTIDLHVPQYIRDAITWIDA